MSREPFSFVPDTVCPASVVLAVNHNERQAGRDGSAAITMLVLHYTGMESGEAAQDWLCGEESGVSCHYLVHEDGAIVQMVPERLRAWHAGKSFWRGETDINSRSVGIEIVNPGHEWGYRDFPEAQMKAVTRLAKDIVIRHAIEPRNVVAHSDIAPERKEDPGERFRWDLLARADVGLWVPPEPVGSGKFFAPGDRGEPIEAIQSMLAMFGYGVEISGTYDVATEAVIRAFQRRFRQEKVDGIADMSTITTLHRLLGQLPEMVA